MDFCKLNPISRLTDLNIDLSVRVYWKAGVTGMGRAATVSFPLLS